MAKVNCSPMHPGLVVGKVNCSLMHPGRKLKLNKRIAFKRKAKLSLIIVAFLVLLTEISPPVSPLFPFATAGGALAAEIPEATYTGDTAAAAVLGNLGYTDLAGGNIWSKEAIYETGALGVVKGFATTSKKFGRTIPLTKEEAIAIAYRAAGREAEALQAGIALNNARAAANKKTDPLSVLYDGFLQLAANESLITAQNLADALNADQTTLTAESFRRTASAQRQEMAFWLAKTLNIQPVGQQQETLNYTDWRSTDPDKLPYMEAILQQGIMTGSGGRINPTQSITREQGAQVVKNSETPVLGALKYVKNSGTVEIYNANERLYREYCSYR